MPTETSADLKQAAYDAYNLNITRVQLGLVTNPGAAWREELQRPVQTLATVLRIIDPFDIQVDLARSLINTIELPRFKVNLTVSALVLHMLDTEWKLLESFYMSQIVGLVPDEQKPLIQNSSLLVVPVDVAEVNDPSEAKLLELTAKISSLACSVSILEPDGSASVMICSCRLKYIDLQYSRFPCTNKIQASLGIISVKDHWEKSPTKGISRMLKAGSPKESVTAAVVTASVPDCGVITVDCHISPLIANFNAPTIFEIMKLFNVGLHESDPLATDSVSPQDSTSAIISLELQRASLNVNKGGKNFAKATVISGTLTVSAKKRVTSITGNMEAFMLHDLTIAVDNPYQAAIACGRTNFDVQVYKCKPVGCEFDNIVKLSLREAKIHYINCFVMGLIDHMKSIFGLRAVLLQQLHRITPKSNARTSLDIRISRSFFLLPRSAASPDFICASVGDVVISNSFVGNDELIAVQVANGGLSSASGDTIFHNASGVITVKKPIAAYDGSAPEVEVSVDCSELVGTLTQQQFNLLIGLGFENIDAYVAPRPGIPEGQAVPEKWRIIDISIPRIIGTLEGVYSPNPFGEPLGPRIGVGTATNVRLRVELRDYRRMVTATVDNIFAQDILQQYGEQVAKLLWSQDSSIEKTDDKLLKFYYCRLQHLDKRITHTIDINLHQLYANVNHCTLLALLSFFNPLPDTWKVIHPPTKPLIPDKYNFKACLGNLGLVFNNVGHKFANITATSVNISGTHDEETVVTSLVRICSLLPH